MLTTSTLGLRHADPFHGHHQWPQLGWCYPATPWCFLCGSILGRDIRHDCSICHSECVLVCTRGLRCSISQRLPTVFHEIRCVTLLIRVSNAGDCDCILFVLLFFVAVLESSGGNKNKTFNEAVTRQDLKSKEISVRLCGLYLVSRSQWPGIQCDVFFATEVVTGEPGHTFSRFDILDFPEWFFLSALMFSVCPIGSNKPIRCFATPRSSPHMLTKKLPPSSKCVRKISRHEGQLHFWSYFCGWWSANALT